MTLPTTRYKSAKPLPASLLAGDHAQVAPAPAHLPLVFMLVLTQLAVGASVAALFAEPVRTLSVLAAVVSAVALGIASLHLGKPLKAWRAFLGWRQSWFSREVIAFGGYVPLALTNAAAFWLAPLTPWQPLIALATAATGLLGVACSAMIYVDTHRKFWRASQTFGKFLGTTVMLGVVTLLALTGTATGLMLTVLLLATVGKMGIEHQSFHSLVALDTPTLTPLNRSARLLTDELGLAGRLRVVCGLLGGVALPLTAATQSAPSGLLFAALGLCVVGELLERYLFFTAVAPAKMPGGFAS